MPAATSPGCPPAELGRRPSRRIPHLRRPAARSPTPGGLPQLSRRQIPWIHRAAAPPPSGGGALPSIPVAGLMPHDDGAAPSILDAVQQRAAGLGPRSSGVGPRRRLQEARGVRRSEARSRSRRVRSLTRSRLRIRAHLVLGGGGLIGRLLLQARASGLAWAKAEALERTLYVQQELDIGNGPALIRAVAFLLRRRSTRLGPQQFRVPRLGEPRLDPPRDRSTMIDFFSV